MNKYENRCKALADQFAIKLDKFVPSEELSNLVARMQADLILADYKFKFRQADHVKLLLWGPWAISFATLVLSVVVAYFQIFPTAPKRQDNQASLILKVLAAPPGEADRLLNFFTNAGLLNLTREQRQELEALVRK